jgi:hypothetical protein
MSIPIEFNGLYTVLEVNGAWRVLFVEKDELTPKEHPINFVTKALAKKYGEQHHHNKTYAEPKAFKMAIDTQKIVNQMNQ